jgi:hypothetical protein
MFDTLKKLQDDHKIADFLFPALPKAIKGQVIRLTQDRVIIESDSDGDNFQYICHPNAAIIVQKKAG